MLLYALFGCHLNLGYFLLRRAFSASTISLSAGIESLIVQCGHMCIGSGSSGGFSAGASGTFAFSQEFALVPTGSAHIFCWR
jgi:hypothetical protein